MKFLAFVTAVALLLVMVATFPISFMCYAIWERYFYGRGKKWGEKQRTTS